jgi:enoyl-CoA hydratase/carnithine racemase
MSLIEIEQREGVFHIELNRPDAENRLTIGMLTALGHAFTQADDDSDVRCLLISGRGPDFCTGADLSDAVPAWALGRNPIDIHDVNPWGVVGRRRRKPLVAFVHGRCHNGGLELALAADMCVAADNARFAFEELRFGTYPFAGGVFRMIRAAGWVNAMQYILTGEEFGAEDALRLRLVGSIRAADEGLAAAEALATGVCAGAPLAVEAALAQAQAWADVTDAAGFARSIPDIIRLLNTKDAAESYRAMKEGRAPRFARE